MAKKSEDTSPKEAQEPRASPSSKRGGGIKAEAIRMGLNLIAEEIMPISRRPRNAYTSNLFHNVLAVLFGWTGAGTKLVGVRGDGALRVYNERPLPEPYPVDLVRIGGAAVGTRIKVERGVRIGRIVQTFTSQLGSGESDVWVPTIPVGVVWQIVAIEVTGGSAVGASSGNQTLEVGIGTPATLVVKAIWPYSVTPWVVCNEPINGGTPLYPTSVVNWSEQIRRMIVSNDYGVVISYINGTNGTITATRTMTIIYEQEEVG